jgi:hypothetical protein
LIDASILLSDESTERSKIARVTAEPGICGFPCKVIARKIGKRRVSVEIIGSECQQVKKLANSLTEMTLKELFLPLTRNPVYIAAEKSGCHPSCAIPSAVLKAVEVAMDMALPKDVQIIFQPKNQSEG